jgi:general secretion pathway protein D
MTIMNKVKQIAYFSCIALSICTAYQLHGMASTEDTIEQNDATLLFSFDNEDLTNIINTFANIKGVNIIFPQADPINTKITLHIDKRLTINECWDLLGTVLDVAGFTMVPHENNIRIIKNPGKEISREPMPTYIGVNLDDLPKTDQYIRYLYYLANIKVSDAPENELNGILKDLLPDTALFKADSNTNGLLLVAKANDIQAAMKIIIELDTVGFQEKVDILSLNHTSAGIVAQLLNEQILKIESQNAYRLDTKKAKEVPYFSGFTKVIPEERLNKLILLGRAQAVDRLKSFIKTYIDIAPDSGKSMLHVYRLQYLDAIQFVPVLKSIVEGSRSGGPSQARGGEKTVGGVERFFDEVVIFADKPTTESEELKYYGGNKIIVSARNDDWKQIKKIIEDLDQPQRQVLLEVLIADLTVDDTKALGAMTRVPDKIPFPDTMTFQTAQLDLQPIPNQLPDPTSLDADLLQNAYKGDKSLGTTTGTDATAVNNVATFAQPGTTMLSLNDNDGRTWSILELQQALSHSKIISHPHVMATNNKEASVTIGEQRYLKDAASGSLGGTTVINYKPINANLKVKITPRISTADAVNLQVLIDINEFLPGSDTQTIRQLETNANIKSGGIFALGGLIKNTTTNSITETPFLNKVPILGWFFKKRRNEIVQNNLTVFICPTIIEPRLRAGVNEYTADYIKLAKDYAGDDLFSNLKDPITHWFFKSPESSDEVIDTYVARTQGDGSHSGTPTKRASIRKAVINNDDQPLALNGSAELLDLKEKLKNDTNPFIKA